MTISTLTAVVLSALACWFDLKTRRIPNWLTYPSLLLAGVLSAAGMSIEPSSTFLGFLIGLIPALLLFQTGILGGGDVKLLAVLGALFGSTLIVTLLLWSVIFGAVVAVLSAIHQSRGAELMFAVKSVLLEMFYGVKKIEIPLADQSIPFALPVFLASLMTIFVR